MPRAARLGMLCAALLAGAAPRAARPAPDRYGAEPRATVSEAEDQALAIALARFSAEGARPRVSSALVAAARLLAQQGLEGGDPTRRRAVRDALARARAYDAGPMIYAAYGARPALAEAVADALGPGVGSATHVGAGVVERDGAFVAVILASTRGAQLDPFPQRVEAGARAALSGQLRAGLCDARVFVTRPSGRVEELAAPRGVWFRVTVPFAEPGRHVVEVLADGPQGPTVAALFPVAAGGAALEEPRDDTSGDEPRDGASPDEPRDGASPDEPRDGASPDEPRTGASPDEPRDGASPDEPRDGASPDEPRTGAASSAEPARAEAAVLAALQALRARRGLPPLVADPKLAEVARRHSEAMRRAGTIGHAVPGSPAPDERLRAARIPYRRLFENVAASSTALEAHAAAEASPAHLRNMLEPGVRRVGVGLARELSASGRARVYLAEIFVE